MICDPLDKARAEHAFVALLESTVEPNDVGRVVRAVGHHDRHRAAAELGEHPGGRPSRTRSAGHC